MNDREGHTHAHTGRVSEGRECEKVSFLHMFHSPVVQNSRDWAEPNLRVWNSIQLCLVSGRITESVLA